MAIVPLVDTHATRLAPPRCVLNSVRRVQTRFRRCTKDQRSNPSYYDGIHSEVSKLLNVLLSGKTKSFLSRLIHEVFRISKYDSFVMLQHLLVAVVWVDPFKADTTPVEPLVALITSNTLLIRITNVFFIFTFFLTYLTQVHWAKFLFICCPPRLPMFCWRRFSLAATFTVE